jgi:hypothetical protein
VSLFGKDSGDSSTYVPGSAGHKDLHKKGVPLRNSLV